MNILLCMPKFIDTKHPGCNGGGAWGYTLEKQFKRLGWNVTFLNSFEDDYVPFWRVSGQDIIIFRHSYQTNFNRYKDIVSKVDPGTLIVQNYIEDNATTDWESFKVCKETDIWLGQSNDQVELARKAGYKSRLLHYPLDLSKFSSIPRMNKNILYVGRFCPYKGTEVLMEAFKIVKEKHPNATLTLKGAWSWGYWGSKYDRRFMNYASSTEITARKISRIRLINGWTSPETIYDYYNESSILVFPVSGEGYGGPIVEAQAAAMPVITSGFPSQKEKITEGEDGYFISNTWLDTYLKKWMLPDPEKIAEKINFFFDNMEMINVFGKRARAKAEHLYDENKVMKDLIDYLIKELEEKRNVKA